MLDRVLPGAQHLQNLHPLVVHFPIAFLPAAALFYFLSWLSRKDQLARAAFVLLCLGTIGALIAVGSGLYAEDGVMISRSVRAELLRYHKEYMLLSLAVSAILNIWALLKKPFPKEGRYIFLSLLLVLSAILARGADYGARMVYDYNAGGSACAQPIDFSK